MRMTREEAMAILEEVKTIDDSMYQYNPAYLEALEMAIAALKAEPCGDAVSREAVLDLFETIMTKSEIYRAVIKLPPVTPKPRTGKWIRQGNDYTDYYECEHCGIAVGLDDIKNFCPNCGCRMMEGEEE